MEETEKKKDEESEVRSCVGASSKSPIPTNDESKRTQEVLPTKDDCKEPSEATEEVERADENQASAEQKNVMSNKKRSSSVNPNEQESAGGKKPKLDNVSHPSNDPAMTGCRAPFKSPAESILTTIDPGFTNVFLAAGWRTRWCPCPDCRQVLGRLSWLVEEEEDVWEPGEDTDSC
jgi:E3 ubiquitin-protein ligase UBR7